MSSFVQDLRGGLRRLVREPGLTALQVATLAVGLSASTAVFTYVNAYTRSFPGVRAEALHQVWLATRDEAWGALSLPDFEDLTRLDGARLSVTGVGSSFFMASVRHDQLAEVAQGEAAAGDFFSILDVEMSVGRGLSSDDDRPGASPVAVLSHAYWLSRYDAAPDVVGRTILLNNEPYTIVGVVGPEFLGSSDGSRPSFWIPLEQFLRVYRPGPEVRVSREAGVVSPIVRIASGVSMDGAEDALGGLAAGLDRDAPLADRSRRFVLAPATWISPATRDAEASTTRVMVAASVFLLLLACANVASLVLSSGARRRPEMAVRGAMGASRGRLVRQLLTESLVVSLPAGLVALALAGPLSRRLSSYFARPSVWGEHVPREIVVDSRVMVIALLAAVATGAVAALMPALRVSERSPGESLGARQGGPGRGRGPRAWLPGTRDLLVSTQIAICVVLLFVAGLVLRTLESARDLDPGLDTRQTLASYVSTSSIGTPIPQRHRFFEELKRRFEQLPWVEGATIAENAPISGHPVQRFPVPGGAEPLTAVVARVWPGYFEVMGMEIVRGRALAATDTSGAAQAVVVNQSFAERLVAGGDAVGRDLVWPGEAGAPDQLFEIVGVARDASQVTLLDPPGPVAYFSLPQLYSRPGNALLLRVRGDPAVAVQAMERELKAVDTRLAIVNILSYRDVVRGELYTQRMNAELFTLIAALGLALSVAGVFAVLALAIAGRRREIGIRMAVGADPERIATAVLGPLAAAVLTGLGLGFVGAMSSRRLVEGLLWGVTPTDPVSLGFGIGVLLVSIGVATAIPLRAALATDPVAALRTE